MPSATVLLIRHCRATGQAAEDPLTPDGVRAAEALAGLLQALQVDALFSSPLARARATLAPFARQTGLPVGLDPRLAERILAVPPSAGWLEQVRASFADPDYRAPGGESLREAQNRGLAAVREIAEGGHRLPAIATHGNLLAGILRSADESFGFTDWERLRNPELFRATCLEGKLASFERVAFQPPS
jgi:2,3-bisphosphoglycerate-dependent phosphoglycerate mutase